jgi:hypothetical protein
MDLDTSKSLNQLFGARAQDASESGALATTCLTLYEKSLKDFSVENLRVMIGQNIGLEFLIPFAFELLRENLFIQGDYYPGDLLSVVMQAESVFGKRIEPFIRASLNRWPSFRRS